MSLETKHFFDFEEFRLDSSEKLLMCGGKSVPLTPKVFETLEILLQNSGHLLEKNELIGKLWQDRFVDESNLTFNIKMLRKALGDDAVKPRFIETVPRRGYRFIAEVREIIEETGKNPPIIKVLSPPRRKLRLPLAAFVVLLLGTIVIASWLTRNKKFYLNSAPVLSAPFHSEKFSNSGKVTHAIISPDGKLAAFTDATGDKYAVWLRRLEISENVQIVPPSDDLYYGLAFAHDGQTIYFVRSKQIVSTFADIYRVSIFGGVPEKIVEHAEGWISVSPDDRQISFVRCDYEDADFCSLLIADVNGKNERKVLTRPRPIRLSDNQFSPDGQSIVFADGQSLNGSHEFRLRKFDMESSLESSISPKNFFDIVNLKWLPDDSLIVAAKENLDGREKIWQISIASGEARPLTNDANNYEEISIDKDADKIIAIHVANDFRLQVSFGGTVKNLTNATHFTFTPDDKIVYSTTGGDIWTINRDGGEQRQLTSDQSIDFEPRVSPDGQYIFFASNRSGTNQIWRMNADGSNQTQVSNGEGGYPRFVSPDEKWIYYESGLHQTLWKVSTGGGESIEVFDQKVYAPAFSPDGNLVAYFTLENRNRINVINIEDKKLVKVLSIAGENPKVVNLAWTNDNQTLEYVVSEGSKNSLWAQSLSDENRRFITDLSDEPINDFALAPDTAGFAFIHGKWLHDAILIDGLK